MPTKIEPFLELSCHDASYGGRKSIRVCHGGNGAVAVEFNDDHGNEHRLYLLPEDWARVQRAIAVMAETNG